jgi:FtsP/CotA-like multicopper oxidase with cupredoxin domain
MRWGLPLSLSLAAAIVAFPQAGTPLARAAVPESGLVCTSTGGPRADFALTTATGYALMADGNTVFMWAYTMAGSTGFQLPGPTLCVNQGDTVTVALTNTLPEDVSIVFPGQQAVQANGAPAGPQFDASGKLVSLMQPARKNGGSVTYSFTAAQPGTYIYESGSDPGKQVQMGLYGMLVVRPAGHADWAYNDAATQFNPSTEYMLLFSEVDPFLHLAVERNQAYDVTALRSRYWMINGRTFPDTIQPNGAATLPQQPQGALVHIRPQDPTNRLPALVRYGNVGEHDYPFHPHGMHGRVIAKDGRVLRGPASEDLSYEKFTVLVGMGQTYDATYIFTDIEQWSPTRNSIPVALPQQQNLTYKGNTTWFSGSPYLGFKGPLPTGVTQLNQCGEYYQAWHNHDLYQAANYDAGFGGQFTLERIDPPLPNSCP